MLRPETNMSTLGDKILILLCFQFIPNLFRLDDESASE